MLTPGTEPGHTEGGPGLGKRKGVQFGYTGFKVPAWHLNEDIQKAIENNKRTDCKYKFKNCREKSFITSKQGVHTGHKKIETKLKPFTFYLKIMFWKIVLWFGPVKFCLCPLTSYLSTESIPFFQSNDCFSHVYKTVLLNISVVFLHTWIVFCMHDNGSKGRNEIKDRNDVKKSECYLAKFSGMVFLHATVK